MSEDNNRYACREQLASWMIERGFSTGHGDSMEELLSELSWQVKELRIMLKTACEIKRGLHPNDDIL